MWSLVVMRLKTGCKKTTTTTTTTKTLKLSGQNTEVLLCGSPTRRESVPVDSLSIGEASVPLRVDRQLEGRMSLLTAFRLAKRPFRSVWTAN